MSTRGLSWGSIRSFTVQAHVSPMELLWSSAPHMCKSILQRNFVQEVCGQFRPCTSAQTKPTPDVTLTLTLTLTPTPWGARGRLGQSRGSAACFGGVFFPKKRAAQKASLGQ